MKHLVETLIEQETVAQGKFLQLRRDKVSLPNGNIAWREYIEHPGAVAMVALTADGHIVLERQYRHPCRAVFIEVPAGKLDKDEAPLLAAARELKEETGYHAATWQHLADIPLCIGYSNEILHYYLATDLTLGERELDEGEFLDVFTVPLKEALAMSLDGRITDAKTIVALHLAQGHLAQAHFSKP